MQRLKKKLHSNSGASILMALLVMLVAVMVSAVIIAAAVSAAVSVREERAQQQAYLTVSSAAELIRDELESGKDSYKKVVTVTESRTYYGSYWGWSDWTAGTETTTETEGDGVFSDIIKDGLDFVQKYPSSVFNETYTIGADDNSDVAVEVFMQQAEDNGVKYYDLKVTFEGGEEPNKCKMMLTMRGSADTQTVTGETTTEYPYRGDYGKTEKRNKITTTTTEWKNSKLQKEVQ